MRVCVRAEMESDMITLKNMLKFVEADLNHMADVTLDFNEGTLTIQIHRQQTSLHTSTTTGS